MLTVDSVLEKKEKAAMLIAKSHFTIDSQIAHIYRLVNEDEERSDEPIKILEVNRETVAQGIVPVVVGAHVEAAPANVYFPIVIVDITPEEFEQLSKGELRLPEGWNLDQEITRSDVAVENAA